MHDGALWFRSAASRGASRIAISLDLPIRASRRRRRFLLGERDLAKKRAVWTKEKVWHERELARVDACIRRLEWRLKDRDARRKPGERLAHDPAAEVLEANLESLREERKRVEQTFRERARKAGAFPGWLR
jgi:hypothetical protein